MAFLDPEGFEVHFKTVQVLATRQLDILCLFPSGIGIARNIRGFYRQSSSPMDEFLGPIDWRHRVADLIEPDGEVTDVGAQSLVGRCIEIYREQMRGLGYEYFDASEPGFANDRNVTMYHLLFFSKNKAGLKIWHNIKMIGPDGQRELNLGAC